MGSEQTTIDPQLDAIRDTLNVVSTLQKQQREWLAYYLLHGNATKAAEQVGYSYPDKQGPRLRKHPKIQAAIDEYFSSQEMAAAEVVARLSQQARAEYGKYLYWDEARQEIFCDLKQLLADGKGHLIKKVGYERTGRDDAVQVVEFYDAHQALVDIGRYHGLFKDRTDLTSGDEPIQPIQFIREDRSLDRSDGNSNKSE